MALTDLQIRRLASDDAIDELTRLLHRAFAPLGRMGLACGCVAQSAAITAARHLVDWYRAHGFAPVGDVRHTGKACRSVVLRRPIAETAAPASAWQSPHRTCVGT